MQRVMSVWFPFLPTDLFKRRARRSSGLRCDADPVLLIDTVRQQQVVVHACECACGAGIKAGMALSVARGAVCGHRLIVVPFDRVGTGRALKAIALWCHRYSPVVGVEDAEGVCLDVTGCAHLYGGERGMMDRMRAGFQGLGLAARMCVAPTYASARIVARCGNADAVIVEPGGIYEAVSERPVSALGLDGAMVAGFEEVNIRHIGELLKLPRAAVASRFGDDLLKITDRLLGRSAEVIQAVRPVEPLRAERWFDGPCASIDALGQACREMLAELEDTLASRNEGVVEWSVRLMRSDLDPLPIIIRHCVASRDGGHLWHLLQPRLERAYLGFGVEGLVVTAIRTRRIGHAQRSWWDCREDRVDRGDGGQSAIGSLIDALVNRLGPDAVLRAELLASHVPERAFSFRSAMDARGSTSVEPTTNDRPTRLFSVPVLVRVISLTPDGPVSRMEWNGVVQNVIACIGPERIRGEWWRGERLLRDYFKVQDERGMWFWLYRDHLQNQWFLHGVWA